MTNQLFEFELEIMFEKHEPYYREEWHRYFVIAKNHDEARKIVDKQHGEDVSCTYSVNKTDRNPTTKYREPRIIHYSFLVSNDDDERNDDKIVESNLTQLQGWKDVVKENKDDSPSDHKETQRPTKGIHAFMCCVTIQQRRRL